MARSSSLSPGFRFHPTDVELVMYYLKKKLLGKKLIVEALAEVNIYDFSPWDLPDKSNLRSGDLEWFFFCPKARKYLTGSRSNRATETGFWKATGKDRPVEYNKRTVAMIKTLVFHRGHAPNGDRTDWVMHEYRMEDKNWKPDARVVQDKYVVCKVFKKSGSGPKNGAQYGAPFNEEEWDDDESSAVVGPDGATISITVPQRAYSLCLTEPGSSIVMTSANDSHVDVPPFDDAVLTAEEIALIMDDKGNNKYKAEEIKAKSADDDIYDDLASLINLEDLGEIASNTLKSDYTLVSILKDFYVD